jgi:thiol-disulfide isomerase/thioredoxin
MRVKAFLLAVGFLVLAGFFTGSEAGSKAKIGRLPSDKIASRSLRTLDGKQFSLSSLRGQVVVIDFFAVWCAHSRDHLPALNRFYSPNSTPQLQIIGLAVEDQTTPERLSKFINDEKIGYPVGMVDDPTFAGFVGHDVSVPQTLVYGRDGKLVAHYIGQSPEADANLVAKIQAELSK